MIHILKQVKESLPTLIISHIDTIKTMYIDYHKPYVSRMWFQFGDYRVFLHAIEPCITSTEALFHPHKWESAMEILSGKYEMGVGYSETNDIPKTACKLILNTGSIYEMTEPNAWHYVNPTNNKCYTLMVTGKLNGRQMPIEPDKDKVFRKLSYLEIHDILNCIDFHASIDIYTLALKIAQN